MSTTNKLDFTNFTIKVARFDVQYPEIEPDSFVVGFTVTSDINGRSMYSDTRIYYPDANGKTEQEIVSMAWERVGPTFEAFVSTVNGKAPIVGSIFVP